MLRSGELKDRFDVYWSEFERCRKADAYFALLHLAACLPDICAALQASNGETSGAKYVAWCRQFADDPQLTPEERYRLRCKLLHQGRARTDQSGRYTGFAFGRPGSNGSVDHLRLDGTTLCLDVDQMAVEMKAAVLTWIGSIEGNPSSAKAIAVAKHLGSLIHVRQFERSNVGQPSVIIYDLKSTS